MILALSAALGPTARCARAHDDGFLALQRFLESCLTAIALVTTATFELKLFLSLFTCD